MCTLYCTVDLSIWPNFCVLDVKLQPFFLKTSAYKLLHNFGINWSTLAETDNLESSNNPEFFLHGKLETLMFRVNKKCNMEWRSRLLCY